MKEGWKLKNLGEVCDIFNGGTPKTKVKEYWNGEINWITPKDLGKLESKYVYETPRKITKLGLAKSSAKLFPENSIILSTRAPIGHLAINKTPMSTNQGCRGIVPNESIKFHFLYYFLKGNIDLLNDLGTGTTFKELSTKNLSSVNIPIPPLPEQKAIVAILDQAFAAIDNAKANIEKNIENAKELFQSKLNEIFSQKGDGWEEKPINALTEIVTKGSSPKWQGVNYITEPGILFVTSENVGEGKLLMNKRKYLETKFNDIQGKSILKKGDVLTNIVGASIGRTAIYDIDEIANINQAVCILRCKDSILYNYYLMNMLNSPFFKSILHDNEVNNARANLSLTFFKNLVIPFPKLEQQKEIVHEIEKLNNRIEILLDKLQNKLSNIEELKKSLLQKAFAGELT